MPKEEDERIWREFIENGGNLKNQTERIKKDLAKRKSNLVEKKRRNLPKPANLTKRLIKKIATKKIQINSTLDLHGHNKTSAKLKFTNFIKDCQKNKQKYILIITGKGKGLIREALFEWIDEEEIFPLIVGYSHAHRLQGGEGAFVLHLRKQ
jgi:DNA-nicking Smr family endonuclease